MTGTKTLRYDTTVLDARALADALEAEEKAGWAVSYTHLTLPTT